MQQIIDRNFFTNQHDSTQTHVYTHRYLYSMNKKIQKKKKDVIDTIKPDYISFFNKLKHLFHQFHLQYLMKIYKRVVSITLNM